MATLQSEFDHLVKTSQRVYTRKYLYEILKKVKQATKLANKGLIPYIAPINGHENVYKCMTCGTSNKSHPVTSYCFVCNTDNWTMINS